MSDSFDIIRPIESSRSKMAEQGFYVMSRVIFTKTQNEATHVESPVDIFTSKVTYFTTRVCKNASSPFSSFIELYEWECVLFENPFCALVVL